MLQLNNMRAQPGATHKRKRVGRGVGSGWGQTAGRGGKGQTARKSGNVRIGFEGGQTPLYRRLPKRGFKHAKVPQMILNLPDLDGMGLQEISLQTLQQVGVAKGKKIERLVVLGTGDVKGKYHVKAHRFSASAREKIEKAGGQAEVIPGKKKFVRPAKAPKVKK